MLFNLITSDTFFPNKLFISYVKLFIILYDLGLNNDKSKNEFISLLYKIK